MLKTVYRISCRDKHNCQRRDSNLDPLTPQSDALTARLLNVSDEKTESRRDSKIVKVPVQKER